MSTDQIDIAAIRARVAAATPGPWAREDDGDDYVAFAPGAEICRIPHGQDAEECANLIAHAPADLAALCDEVERLTEENRTRGDAATKALDAIAKLCGCPQWDYPGQVARDVGALATERDRARAEVERLRTENASVWAGYRQEQVLLEFERTANDRLIAERDALRAIIAGRTTAPAHRHEVLCEIDAERTRQDAKWGEQNHPDVSRALTDGEGGCSVLDMAAWYGVPTPSAAREDCDISAKEGRCTWAHILVEEVAEAIEAATLEQQDAIDAGALRKELVQVAAVAVSWIEAIDRRKGALRG